jgi:hypothetical protein
LLEAETRRERGEGRVERGAGGSLANKPRVRLSSLLEPGSAHRKDVAGINPRRGSALMSEAGATIGAVRQPFLVELINHTGWIQLWLPFITAMVGAAVALFSVFVSNKTNRKAIDAADARSRTELSESRERDFRTWQRDALLRFGDEVVEAAIDAFGEYGKAIGLAHTWTREEFHASMEIVDARTRRIGANVARLRLIGAHYTADRCVALRNALNHRELATSIIEVARAPQNRIGAALHGQTEEFDANIEARQSRRDELLAEVEVARAAFGLAVEQELARTNAPLTRTALPRS